MWARDYQIKDIAQEEEVDKNVACYIMNWFSVKYPPLSKYRQALPLVDQVKSFKSMKA